ncbi:HAD hydrolase family protein [Candidatus Roizmanbacteria bacterium]|nr:HAD hydrolase family protein [Candidatus Roizmanbacteria bacterium]
MNYLEKLGQQNLEEVKPKLGLIAADYDETLRSRYYPDFTDNRAIELIKKTLTRYTIIITTARGATAIRTFLPHFSQSARQSLRSRFFLAEGNGRMLYELTNGQPNPIYDHGLTSKDIKSILELYDDIVEKLNIQPNALHIKGLEAYRKIISQNWDGFIPTKFFEQCRKYKGRVFTEKAKVGLVKLLNEKRNESLISDLSDTLERKYPNKFQVIVGDVDIHIVKKLREDGKVTAVKTVTNLLRIKLEQVATFGDLPEGNDRGLLTSFPFSFTNAVDFCQKKADPAAPPFLLPGASNSPIGCVHQAIDFLIQ